MLSIPFQCFPFLNTRQTDRFPLYCKWCLNFCKIVQKYHDVKYYFPDKVFHFVLNRTMMSNFVTIQTRVFHFLIPVRQDKYYFPVKIFHFVVNKCHKTVQKTRMSKYYFPDNVFHFVVNRSMMSNFVTIQIRVFHFLIPVRQTGFHYIVNDVLIFVKQFKRPWCITFLTRFSILL